MLGLYLRRFAANVLHMRTYPTTDSRRAKKVPLRVGIKHLREAHGWTQDQVRYRVAEIMGTEPISRGSLSAIESGARGASIEVLAALAEVYGLTVTDLTLMDAA